MKKNGKVGSKHSRRDFLRMLALSGVGLCGVTWRPKEALALGNFKVLVRIELLGGCDQHGLWLPTAGNRFSALANRRQNAMFAASPAGLALPYAGSPLGLHPNLAPLIPHSSRMKIFLNTSNDLLHGQTGSHEDAQNIMAIGAAPQGGRFRGWTAALFDNAPEVQLIGFVGARGINTNCDSSQDRCSHTPPPTVETFESFSFEGAPFSSALGGSQNAAYVANILKRLAEARSPDEARSVVERKFKSSMMGTFSAISDFKTTLNYPSPRYASYGNSQLSKQLRSVAMKIRQLKDTGSDERYIFTLGVGGFDVHRDWLGMTGNLMKDLGQSLGTFMSDLQDMAALNNTVVVAGTEFGRQLASNGSGTDHGNGSTTIVLGGKVKGGTSSIFGDVLTPTEFANLDSAPARIDTRGVISAVLRDFMGIEHTKAFPAPIASQFAVGNYDLWV